MFCAFLFYTYPVPGQTSIDRGSLSLHSVFSGHNDQIHAAQRILVVTERFPDQALQAVAGNSTTRDFSRNRDSQPRSIKLVAHSINCEQPVVTAAALGNCCPVLSGTKQPQTTGKPGVIHEGNVGRARCCSGAELRATFGSAGANNGPTAMRFHSRAKAVSTFAFDLAGLEGSFHLTSSLFAATGPKKASDFTRFTLVVSMFRPVLWITYFM